MSNKLAQRYAEIEATLGQLRQVAAATAEGEAIQARIVELETKQAELKKTLLHLIALSKLRDEAWRTLAYGTVS
jgi:hypothetical protein